MDVKKAPAAPAAPVPARLWLGLLALALSAMMHGVDAMVVTVANPTIGAEMHTGLAELQWVTTGYMLAYAATLVTAGKLGDRFGQRRVFLIGLVGFIVASGLVGVAQDIGTLIAFRVVQGAFGASLLPSALAILRLTFPEDKLKVAVGVFMGTFALSSASGPFLGGVVVEYAGWRWAFYINVIGGLIALAMVLALIAPTPPQDARRRVDLPGMALLTVTILALVLGINQVPERGWTGALPLACFAVALAAGVLYALRERTAGQPLTPPELFRSRAFAGGNLLLLLGSGVMFAAWFHLALYFQNVQGAGALRAGLELLPIPATGIIAAPLGGLLNQKLGPRPPLLAGTVLLMVGLFGITRAGVDTGYHSLWPYLIALGISMSFIVPIGTEVVISSAPKRLAGVASGVGETMGSLGPAIGVASVGTAIALVVENGLAGKLTGAGVPTGIADRMDTESVALGAAPVPSGTPDELVSAVVRQAHEAFASGMHAAFAGAMVLSLLCLPLIWLIKVPRGDEEAAPDEAAASEPAHAADPLG
ncbi:MFS transporter [Actinomadura geliboluensis]|uniref:MFS transporter n=1 Tax=Actinomadura geliboluensis TaxID=882440 RepID=UPI0036B0552B